MYLNVVFVNSRLDNIGFYFYRRNWTMNLNRQKIERPKAMILIATPLGRP